MRWAKAGATVTRQPRCRAVAVLVAGSVVAVAGCGPPPGPGHRVADSEPKALPAFCDLGGLRWRMAASVSSAEASGQVISLRNVTGRACVLPTYWPTVRLRLGGSGHGPVGKALPLPAEFLHRALYAFFAPYRQSETFTLGPEDTASLVILWLMGTGCQRYHSVKLYPSALALGAGSIARLARPVKVCGTAFFLPYLSGDLGAAALRVTVQQVAKMRSRLVIVEKQLQASDR
jgi:hypothetical protein